MKKYLFLFIILISIGIYFAYPYGKEYYLDKYVLRDLNPTNTLTVKTKYADVDLNVEIADNDEKRVLGLSNTREIKNGEGMYFIFPTPEKLSFWMKDMYYNLDIIYIDDKNRIIEIFENVKKETYNYSDPRKSGTIISGRNVKSVLELRAYEAKNEGIEVGDIVNLK